MCAYRDFLPTAPEDLGSFVGLKTVPLLLVWMVAQLELYGWRARWPERSSFVPERRPAALAVEDA